LTFIELENNGIGNEGAAAVAAALQVSTSLLGMHIENNAMDESNSTSLSILFARNVRFRSPFLFDDRQMLLSLMCADECSDAWLYLLGDDGHDTEDGIIAADAAELIRPEFGVVVEERRLRRLEKAADQGPVQSFLSSLSESIIRRVPMWLMSQVVPEAKRRRRE
jgi:hypothetical protein